MLSYRRLTWAGVQILIGPTKRANRGPTKKARLNFIGQMRFCYLGICCTATHLAHEVTGSLRPPRRLKQQNTLQYNTSLFRSIMISRNAMLDEVNGVKKVQNETDTRLLLHTKLTAVGYDSIIIVVDDTDVLMLSMTVQARIDCYTYTYGTRATTRNFMPRKCVQLLHKEHVLLCWECTHLHDK